MADRMEIQVGDEPTMYVSDTATLMNRLQEFFDTNRYDNEDGSFPADPYTNEDD